MEVPKEITDNLGPEYTIYQIKTGGFFSSGLRKGEIPRTFLLSEGDQVWSEMKISESISLVDSPKLTCFTVSGKEIISCLVPMDNLKET